ncbi:MAG: bifunctional metallophosphatase/5'-nucleotidase [Clostridium sp.]
MKNLKIYFTSDIHGFIFQTDYRDFEKKELGLLNIINEFDKDKNTLVIDGGDTIQGSPYTTYISKQNFKTHPVSNIMNLGAYDFVTLGNHDFNYGYDYLKKYLDDFNGTCICSNIIDKKDTLPIEPYSIKTLENGLKIGIIGLTTEFIPVWEKKENLENIDVLDSFNSIKKYHDLIEGEVDILIGVYHGGFERDIHTFESLSNTKENLAFKICEELEFDLLLTGHQHMEICDTTLFGTHIVQTPNNGLKYALVNLDIKDKTISISSNLIKPKIAKNKFDISYLSSFEEKVQKWLDTPVGFLDKPLNPESHLEMALNGSPLANFINEVQIYNSNAQIACTSFANSVKGFNKEVTIRDIVSTYIYPNTLVVLEVTKDILIKALYKSSTYFTLNNEKVEISDSFLKPKVEHYNYDYFYNIEYTFDLTKEGLDRVSSVKYNGKDLENDKTYSLVMNNYRASGTGGYEFLKECPIIKEIQVEMTELLINYFIENENIKTNEKKWINIKY